jgi:hypothetical protein
MYAIPAREYIEARDGIVKTGVPAKIRVEGGRVTGVVDHRRAVGEGRGGVGIGGEDVETVDVEVVRRLVQ